MPRGASDVMKRLVIVRLREGRASDDIKFLRSFEGKCGERGWRRRRFEFVCCKQRCMGHGYESDALMSSRTDCRYRLGLSFSIFVSLPLLSVIEPSQKRTG